VISGKTERQRRSETSRNQSKDNFLEIRNIHELVILLDLLRKHAQRMSEEEKEKCNALEGREGERRIEITIAKVRECFLIGNGSR
jgi:hypothetical protein